MISPMPTEHPILQGDPDRTRMDDRWYRWAMRLLRSTNLWLPPPKTIITAALSADDIANYFDATGLGIIAKDYEGWAICNGSNDTPNLADKFIRLSATASGSTGGSDSSAHTHDIDHNHGAVTSAAGGSHTHGAGSLAARIHGDATHTYYDFVAVDEWTTDYRAAIGVAANAVATTEGVTVQGTTAAESAHTHSVDLPALGATNSGAASVSDNKPAYYTLVALMRVEVL